ncbi:hypothetical protein [Moraxella bovis]|uniref:hypothetical protein n=1 Tax=Moraxella bovis TaxID=476 RepID=UPI001FE72711|nr:hypothetical protein [Moraxella bovis]
MASSEATLQARLAELKKAEQSFARLESLLKIDAISRQDYDDAQSAVEVARANVDVARAGVQNAKMTLPPHRRISKASEPALTKPKMTYPPPPKI